MDPQPSAPPVVAVIVANEPGDWFEEALVAMGSQDYPNQSVLVMDAGGNGDWARRVASVLPEAFLRRVPGETGFAAVANEVLHTVEGASFLVFLHDDVAPAPDAVRLLVEEALRSNAGIVAPKVVEWDRPDRLLEVGLAVDKTGACASVVERGELDQEQHDAVRDVFAVSDTCMLIRSDLFGVLGGFDPVMGDHGADVDLCWRAQVAGARVLVAPAARVRHLLGGVRRPEATPERALLAARHHVRAMLKSYSLAHLVRVVPQAAVVTLAEAAMALVGRRWREARELVGAWWWNAGRLGQLRPLRAAVRRSRAVPDADVRRLQARGSVRLNDYLQRRLHAEERARALVAAGHDLVESVGRGPARAATALLAVLVLAIVVGSRHLVFGRLPAVGQFAPLPGPATLLTHYLDGWRTTGMGSASWAPPGFGVLGVAGAVLLGHVGILQKLLVLGAWPVAALGAWRLGRPLEGALPRLVGVVAYLAVPLPYNALARGRWSGLLAYAAAPWLLVALGRLTRLAPFGDPDADTPVWRQVLPLGVAVAAVAALAPAVAIALVLAASGMVLGSVVAGQPAAAARALVGAFAAVGAAVLLLLPWSLELLLPGGWETVSGVARLPAREAGLGALLRFQVGPLGAPPLGWAFPVLAAVPLVLGREWRLAWAVRLWGVALVCVGVAWAGGRGWLPLRVQSPDVLLAPAAAALAAAAALGAKAFEVDLRRYRFGWRQGASMAAGATLAAVTLPVLGGVPDGRWELPGVEVARSVAWMGQETDDGAFRVLWMGDPAVLPLDAWALGEGVAYATSRDGPPDATDLLPGREASSTAAIADALRVARAGGTARLGRLLAPMAVRYIVVPRQLGAGDAHDALPVPAGLSRALGSQLDLRLLPSDAAVAVYENTAWGPGRAVLTGPAGQARLPEERGTGADLAGSSAALPDGGPVRFRGDVPASGPLLLAESPSSRWELRVGGRDALRTEAFGAANAYDVESPGDGVLRYRTPVLRYAAAVIPVAVWIGAGRLLFLSRRRRPGHRPGRL